MARPQHGNQLIRRQRLINTGVLILMLFFSINPWGVRLIPPGVLFMVPVVFFWRVHAPLGLPLWILLPFGFVQDALQGTPMGSATVSYALMCAVLYRYQRPLFQDGFYRAWLAFGAFTLAAGFLYAMGLALCYGSWLYIPVLLRDSVMAMLLYPVLQPLFWPAYRELPKTHRYAK